MGQYYLIANMEKKEKLVIGGSEPGRKLMEFAAKIPVINAVTNLMADRWKGDHVYVVGDYADLDDEKDTYFKALRKWTDKLHLTEFLYGYIDDNFTSFEGDTEEKNYRFIYNARNMKAAWTHIFHRLSFLLQWATVKAAEITSAKTKNLWEHGAIVLHR